MEPPTQAYWARRREREERAGQLVAIERFADCTQWIPDCPKASLDRNDERSGLESIVRELARLGVSSRERIE
jgi:hypothetical protein